MKQFNPVHKGKQKSIFAMWRYLLALVVITIFIVTVVIVADYGGSDSYDGYNNGYAYPQETYADATSPITVEVNPFGNVSITPYEFAPYIYLEEDQYGNILLRLPMWIEAHDVDITLPYGWGYWVFDDNEYYHECDYYCYHYGCAHNEYDSYYHREYYDSDSHYYREYDNPEIFSSIYHDMYIGDAPYYHYPTAILITSIFGGQRGYLGIMPFAARMVVFDHNHNGQADIGFTTTPAGAIGAAHMPPLPERGGYHFIGWTRTQDGHATPPVTANADAATGILFTGASTVAAIQAPVTVYAQWGHQVNFYGNGVALSTGLAATQHSPRVIVAGMSAVEANNTFFWTSPIWPNDISLAGHRFMGWFTRNELTGEWLQRFDGNTAITENVQLIARWETNASAPVTEIIFDLNDGGATNPAEFPRRVTTTSAGTIGAPTFPENPSRTGYRFLGWTRTQDGNGLGVGDVIGVRVTAASSFPASDTPISVYAQWGHQVSFNVAPGGQGPVLNTAQQTGILAAQWGPRLAFDGVSVADTNIRALASPHYNQVWPNNPTWGDHAFMGWWTMENDDFITEITADTPIYGDIEIFARWVRRTVIFNMNDNGVTAPEDFFRYVIPTGSTITPAVWDTTPEINFQTHPITGQRRIAWTRTQDGLPGLGMTNEAHANTGVLVNAASTMPLTAHPTNVYAQWGYVVTFDLNGATNAIGDNPNNGAHFVPRLVAAGRGFVASNWFVWTPAQVWPNHPTPPAGYVFMGWYTREGGVYQDHIGATTPITSDITVYARFEPISGNPHAVYFDRNDGSGALPVSVIPGTNASIPAATWNAQVVPLQIGHPEGLVFMGWTRTQDGLAIPPWTNDTAIHTGVGVAAGGAHIAPMTAYAQWGHQITFDGNSITLPNSGVGNFNNAGQYGPRRVFPGMTFVESNAITGLGGTGGWLHQMWPTIAPTRTGYVFVGWNTQADGMGDWYDQFTPVHGDRDLYAQWFEAPFRVDFDLNGGSSPLPPSDLHVAANTGAAAGPRSIGAADWAAYVVPIAPYKPGHVFMAWTRTSEGYGDAADGTLATAERFRDNSTFTILQAPLTVYAQWGHTVTFTCLFVTQGSNHQNTTPARIISSGRSHAASTSLTWTIGDNNLAWPVDPNRNSVFYRFAGWYTMDEFGNYIERFDAGTPITENLELFTRWERRRVIFHPNDDMSTPPFEYVTINSMLENATSAITAARFPENPSRTGYHFMGWTRTQDGSGFPFGAIPNNGILFTHTSQINTAQGFPMYVYAQWGYSITFRGNGALIEEGTNPANPMHYVPRIVYPSHSVFTTNLNYSWTNLVWPNDPDRFGHVFVGWYTRNAQGAYDQAFNQHTPITGNITLYARWDSVTVTFDPQDGVTGQQDFEVRTVDADGRLRHNMPETPIRTGYRFIAWTRTPSGYGNILPLSLLFTNETHVLAGEAPLTVFAQWGHQVSFNCNFTTLNIPEDANPNNPAHYGPRLVMEGHNVLSANNTFPWHNIVWPNNPTRDGYRFVGWFTSDDQQVTATTIITQDAELHARWARSQVIFNMNDNGETDPQDFIRENVQDNNTIGTANWPANPTRAGFHFMGWTRTQSGIPVPPMTNNNAAANGVLFGNTSVVPPAHTGDFYVYAQWAHRVSFDGNGVTLLMGTIQGNATNYLARTPRASWSVVETNIAYGWITMVWPANPPNANATFVEWNDEPDGSGAVFDENTPIYEDVTLFAIWDTPEVIFHHNDGTPNTDTRNTQPNGTIGVANMPLVDRPGYIFMGWSRTQNGDGAEFLPTTAVTLAETSEQPLEVWAQWGNSVGFIIQGTPLTVITVITGRTAAQTHATPWASAPWPENPISPGQTFMGWYTMTGSSYTTRITAASIINQDTVLHARFGPEVPLVVNFRTNDGTLAIHATVNAAQPGGSIGAGNMPTNPSWGTRHFMGWARSQAGTGVGMGTAAGELFTDNSTVAETPYNVYAQWGHLVSFNGNGVNLTGADPNNPAHYAPRLVRDGMSFEASNNLVWTPAQVWPNNPTNANNRFMGWWTRSGSDYVTEIFPDTVITGDIELFARWELRRVYFNLNGGSQPLYGNAMRPTAPNGQVGNSNMPAIPQMEDHRFIGWAHNQTGGPVFTGTTYVPLADSPLTVYAQWGHQITFTCINGWVATTTRVSLTGMSVADSAALGWTFISVGGAAAVWPATPMRQSYTFSHWQTGGGDVFDENTPITSELNLQAQWTLNTPFRVTFDTSCPGAFLTPGHWGYRDAYEGASVQQSTHSNLGPAPRLNHTVDHILGGTVVPWPQTAPWVQRYAPPSTPGGEPRPMQVETWWTAPGGDQGGGTLFARNGAPSGGATNDILIPWGTAPAGFLTVPVTEDITVYPTWVFRVNFHPNGGSIWSAGGGGAISIPGFWNMNPHSPTHFTHVRDIPAIGPGYEGGTINEHGVLRANTTVVGHTIANTITPMGMPEWDIVIPPMGMIFAGWWDVQFPIDASIQAIVPLGEEAAHGFGHATQYVGTEWIDRNITLYARFILEPPRDRIPITFVVNGGYWWANREGGAWIPLPLGQEHDNDVVLYSRYGRQLGHLHCDDMPIMPLRDGYVFMGWWMSPDGPPDGFLDMTPGTAASHPWNMTPRFHAGITTYEPMTVYAHWEPAYLVTAHPNHGWFMGTPDYAPGDPNARGYRLVARGRTFSHMQSFYNTTRNNSTNPFRSIIMLPPPYRVPVGLPSALPGDDATGASWYISTAVVHYSVNSLSLGNRLRHTRHTELNNAANPRTNFGLVDNPWNMQPDGTGAVFGQNTIVNGPMDIHAQWFSTIIFDANFEVGVHPRPQPANVARNIMEGFTMETNHLSNTWPNNIRLTFPSPMIGGDTTIANFNNELNLYRIGTGLTFVGWNTQRNGTGQWITENTVMEGYPEGTGNVTVFAIWSDYNVFWHNAPYEGALYGGMAVPIFRRVAQVGPEGTPLPLSAVPPPAGDIDDSYTLGMMPEYTSFWTPIIEPGVSFGGWNRERDPDHPNAMAIGPNTDSSPAHTYHGIWNVPVTFWPARGGFYVGPIFIDGNLSHPVGVRVPPGRFSDDDPWPDNHVRGTAAQGNEWTFSRWSDHRWGLFEGLGEEFTRATQITRAWNVYAQWHATVVFDLQGGHINASGSNVIRLVPEAPDFVTNSSGSQVPHNVTMMNDPHRRNRHSNTAAILDHPRTSENQARPVCDGSPACCDPDDPCDRLHSIMYMMPPAPQRPGYSFAGWEWYPNGPSNPPQPFTYNTNIPGNSRVYARWDIIPTDFEFYKTNLGIYEDEPVVELRDGAVFHLYAEESPGVWATTPLAISRSGGYVWDDIGDVWISPSSPATGLVDFTGQINYVHRFRLVEVVPPSGYILRTGYWVIDHIRSGPLVSDPLDHTTWIMTVTEHGESLRFERWDHPSVASAIGFSDGPGSIGLEPSGDEDEEEIRIRPLAWYVGNEPAVRFPFHKSDFTLYRMPGDPDNLSYEWGIVNSSLLNGAEFSIFRWDSRTTSPPAGMAGNVRSDNTGPGQWVYFDSAESTGNALLPMLFNLDGRYQHYQIVETRPPAGFTMPSGQWRVSIAYGTTSPGTGWYYAQHNRWVRVTSISDLQMPDFIRQPELYPWCAIAGTIINNTPGAGEWYVGNMQTLELPRSGGTGRNMFLYSGAFILMLAMGLTVYLAKRRKLPVLLKHR